MKYSISFLLLAISAVSAIASVSYSESYQEKVATVKFDGEISREVLPGGSFTVRSIVPLNPEDSDIILTRDSILKITIGNWSYEGVLGDDPKFVSGKSRSAKIRLLAGEKTVAGLVSIAVSLRAVTLSVSAKTGMNIKGEDFQASPAAESLAAEETRKITLADDIKISLSCELAEGSASAELPLTGTTRFSVKKFGKGENAEFYNLRSVKVSGKGQIQR
jgi:hypothetical protein